MRRERDFGGKIADPKKRLVNASVVILAIIVERRKRRRNERTKRV